LAGGPFFVGVEWGDRCEMLDRVVRDENLAMKLLNVTVDLPDIFWE
jgi:hypothetical protein